VITEHFSAIQETAVCDVYISRPTVPVLSHISPIHASILFLHDAV